MGISMAAAKVRIFIALLIVCAVAFGWEATRNANMQPVTGHVIDKVYRGYIIGYAVQAHSYQFETRVGTVDVIRGLGSLPLNAPVSLAVNPAQPHAARINSVNGRYGLTLTCVALLLLYAVAMAIARRSNISN